MPLADCPNCEEPVHVDSPNVGDTLACGECGTDLEVVGIDPLELQEDETDLDDDDEDEDDIW